ncbi:hypothetical protein HN873_066729 [Arachis hypogaea]
MAIYFNTPPNFCYFHFLPKSPILFVSPFLLPPPKPSQIVAKTRDGARTLSPATCNRGRSPVNASDLFVALKYGAVAEHPAVAAIELLRETPLTRTTTRYLSSPTEHLQCTPRTGSVVSEQRSSRPRRNSRQLVNSSPENQ